MKSKEMELFDGEEATKGQVNVPTIQASQGKGPKHKN